VSPVETKDTEAQGAERPRGRPRRANARPAIIDATLELLAERGFQAATMEAIAARAGVGKNTIYRRWCSKEELVADAIRDLSAKLDVLEGEDIYAVLLHQVRDIIRLFADPLGGRVLPGLLGELHRNPEFAAAWGERVVRPRREAIDDLLRQAIERGELRQGLDPDLIADLLVSPPFVRVLFPFGLAKAPKLYAEELLEAIWHGIAPPQTAN
jgi:AcrR family transcriptional regulator